MKEKKPIIRSILITSIFTLVVVGFVPLLLFYRYPAGSFFESGILRYTGIIAFIISSAGRMRSIASASTDGSQNSQKEPTTNEDHPKAVSSSSRARRRSLPATGLPLSQPPPPVVDQAIVQRQPNQRNFTFFCNMKRSVQVNFGAIMRNFGIKA